MKSYNNHWGVPLTLSRMPRESQFAVFEIGMNHRGEILPLTQLVKPHAALVTTIAPAHVENLGSLENVADEKGDIYAGLEPGGSATRPRRRAARRPPHRSRRTQRRQRSFALAVAPNAKRACSRSTWTIPAQTAEAEILGRMIKLSRRR